MNERKTFLTSHYLSSEHWNEAKKLLDFQIQSPYKYYNKPNFYYFKRIIEKTSKLEKAKYFNSRIANNLFYGLNQEFLFIKYNVPKQGVSLRNFIFFSYPMMVLFYSIGLYLLKLTEQFIKDNKNENIISLYGGDLKFSNGKLVIKDETTSYPLQYYLFKKSIKSELDELKNKIIIRLDIQNYFDNINISKLLELINNHVKHSDKVANNYDKNTIKLIEFYFKFLSNGALPQGENNLSAQFISYLYLFFGDLETERLLNEVNSLHNEILKEFKIIRYLDDIYILLKFEEIEDDILNLGVNIYEDKDIIALMEKKKISDKQVDKILNIRFKRDKLIFDFLNLLTDAFDKILGLRFNKKTEILRLEKNTDKEKLLNIIKKVSGDIVDLDDYSEKNPHLKIDKLCEVLKQLKFLEPSDVFINDNKNLIHGLKLAYDKDVDNLLNNNTSSVQKIEEQFKNFDFSLTQVYPQAITLLISKSEKLISNFKDYIKAKKHFTTSDRDMIVSLLSNLKFEDKYLIKLLRKTDFKEIIEQFDNSSKFLSIKNTGYYKNIDIRKIINLTSEVSLSEQIRMRNFAEKKKVFSVALNHLLNELQLICCLIEEKDIKKYKAPFVKSFLIQKGVSRLSANKIGLLFDRRNNNPISHSGSDVRFAEIVSQEEYFNHKKAVEHVLTKILK